VTFQLLQIGHGTSAAQPQKNSLFNRVYLPVRFETLKPPANGFGMISFQNNELVETHPFFPWINETNRPYHSK
jgi:hypothetical protein